MELIEQYEELVERSSSDISYVWKASAIIAYFLSSLSSYICSMLFSILWAEICGGHCYFWTDQIRYYKEPEKDEHTVSSRSGQSAHNWTKEVVVSRQGQFYCNSFHFACLTSCSVSIIMLMMFLICGKGGYDTRLFISPWRLVLPAFIISLIMMTTTLIAASSFTRAYYNFSEKLYQLVYKIKKRYKVPFDYKRPCEVFQRFTRNHNTSNYDSCSIYWMIQMCLWTMSWSWTAAFFILLVRILMSADFSLLKVKIFSLPKAGPERDAILKLLTEGKNSLTSAGQNENHQENVTTHKINKRVRRKRVL